MLVISRRIGESFVIGDDMEVTVVDITGEKVVLGVLAPRSVPITRTGASGDKKNSPINERGYGRQVRKKVSSSPSDEKKP